MNQAMKPKRLFVLRHGKGGAIVMLNGEPLYFNNKVDAKKMRDEAGGEPTVVVSRGPDNRNNQGV